MADWHIETLSANHEREGFDCGKPPLNEFLRTLAGQYEKRKLGRTFVAVRPDEKQVVGYYTLAASSVAFENVPPKLVRKLPKHPVPVALLGRLAVDHQAQGQGLGERLLMNALHRCLTLSESLGIFAVEVLAIDERAKQFYEKYGFVPFLDNEFHLFLPLKSFVAELEE